MRVVLMIMFALAMFISEAQTLDSLIANDNWEKVRSELTEANKQSVFQKAVKEGAHSIVDQLAPEVDLNQSDAEGNPPLMRAIMNRDEQMFLKLLAGGADPNAPQTEGLEATPLMYAAAYNDVGMINALIEAGASIDQVDKNGDPAINWASYYGYTKAMEALISHGANLRIRSKHGTPVDVVFRLWHADSVADVFRTSGFGVELDKSSQKLVDAVKKGDLEGSKKLLEKGVSPNTKDALGIPALHLACEQGNLQMVRLLVAGGADVNAMNRVGQSALAVAARFGHSSMVRYLLEEGADPNISDSEYQLRPLIGAAIGGDVSIGAQLVAAGSEIDHMDVVNGATPLVWALFYQNLPFAEYMIEQGADPDLTSPEYQFSARSIMESQEHTELLDLVEQKNNLLLGTWTIDQIHYIYPDTTISLNLDYKGRLMVGADHYSIMYNPYGSKRKSPASLSKMTEEEKLYSFQTMVFNSGSYTYSDTDFITTADMAKVAGFEGGVQYYRMGEEDGSMSLTMYDENYPDGQKPEWYQKVEVKFMLRKE
ncbi:MAG: hypothetical protein Tsb0034_21560 [Ekhidna sp.]